MYEAYRGINLNADQDLNEAFVRLECSWKNPTKVLEFPHIASQANVVRFVNLLIRNTTANVFLLWH